MKFSEKKESDSEANVFLHNENLKRKNSRMSGFELRIFRSGRFRIQNLSNNHILEMKYFSETQFLNSIFIEKSGFNHIWEKKRFAYFPRNNHFACSFFRWKIHIWEKKRFASICSANNNKFFTLTPAHFKRHDFEVNLFIENQILKWTFLKNNWILKWSFFLQIDQILKREFFLLADFDKILFENSFCGDKIFLKIRFWVQFILKNQISIKTSV